jgi:hypothetical protein
MIAVSSGLLPPQAGSAFDWTIDDTLAASSANPRPVGRSCHLGNNIAHNWGWLHQQPNSRLLLFDHTLYGVDRNCVPWTVLGDDGMIDAWLDHRGEPDESFVGRHVSVGLERIPSKLHNHLNFAIYGTVGGEDLLARHVRVLGEISAGLNGSSLTLACEELLQAREIVERLTLRAAEHSLLPSLFKRWVRSSRTGHVVMRRITSIERDGNGLTIVDADGKLVFRGDFNDLFATWWSGLQAVSDRLRHGTRIDELSYPRLAPPVPYLLTAALDFLADPDRTELWHAGGSESQYYVRDMGFQIAFAEIGDLLVEERCLPSRAVVRIVPTLSCQLYATEAANVPLLDELLDLWRELLSTNTQIRDAADALAAHPDPVLVGRTAVSAMPPRTRDRVIATVKQFNVNDVNHLPVGHVSSPRSPSYNKYGMCQTTFAGRTPHMPDSWRTFKWSELELLIKLIAELSSHEWR